jgi:thioredoxin 1
MKTLFYFSAPWCQPCEQFGPIMDLVARQGIQVEKVNIDYETDRAKSANISSIPTVVLAENGNEIKRFVGARTFQQVIDFYNN